MASVFGWSVRVTLLASLLQCGSSLLCYSCVSTQPGCTMEKVDWLIHSAVSCPRANDKCVKIIERRGADTRVIRDCLSGVMPHRDDVPADHFEGCRPASSMPNQAVYVDNAISELSIRADADLNVTYCFCEFDQWCNGVGPLRPTWALWLLLAVPLVSLGH